MPPSDLDFARTAHLWIHQHGGRARAKARDTMETLRRRGDEADADTWLRIIGAIGELGTPPTDTRHRRGPATVSAGRNQIRNHSRILQMSRHSGTPAG